MILNILTTARRFLTGLPRAVKVTLAALVALLVLGIAIPLLLMGKPAAFAQRETLSKEYKTLQSSLHAGLSCGDCHVDQRGPVVHGLAVTGDFYRSVLRKKTPEFVKMEKPTRGACKKCHLTDWSYDSKRTSKIPHPAHLRVVSETRDCVTCHKWTAHEEGYQEQHKKMPFSGVCVSFGCHVGWKTAEECSNCHHSLLKPGEWKRTHPKAVFAKGDRGCFETCHQITQCRACHTTGKSTIATGTQLAAEAKVIEAMHVKSDWVQKHGMLALEDQSRCLNCHVSLDECQACHSQKPASHGLTRTAWIGTHKSIPKKDSRRCVTCHDKSWCDDCHKQFKEMR